MVETVPAAIAAATARLAGTSDTPRLDAELLMAHALGVERDALLLGRHDRDAPPAAFAGLVERRAAHEPVAYITGSRGFWDLDLAVSPAVLIPRPDSETLIEAAIEAFRGRTPPRRVLDLGTGSGALLLAALRVWPGAEGVGIDRSAAALAVAETNAARNGLDARATFRCGDWSGTGERFDLILCNPPYIGTGETLPPDVARHEPAGALFAGADGLDDYRRIAPLLASQLAPAGVACLEIGWTQADAVQALLAGCGLHASLRRDLAGQPRCLLIQA